MKLTIGMPSYNNYQEVWFTVQSLRIYHDLTDCEILIIDNYGKAEQLEKFCNAVKIRYIKWDNKPASHVVKNRIFENANGKFSLCIDSHIFLMPGTINKLKKFIDSNPNTDALYHGPMLNGGLGSEIDYYNDEWRGDQLGTWGPSHLPMPNREPFEIDMAASGLMFCKSDTWLGFNEKFRGFGGGEGYIHKKYKKHGKKIICLPFLQWVHYFKNQWGKQEPVPYPLQREDRIRNFLIGYDELGLDIEIVKKHFKITDEKAEKLLKKQKGKEIYNQYVNEKSDINEHLPTLKSLATDKRVTEFGVRSGRSTVALLNGKPKKLNSYDIRNGQNLALLHDIAKEFNVNFRFKIADCLQEKIEETDVLFIDTIHNYDQLSAELLKHNENVTERIVIHDTATFGDIGQGGKKGMNQAIMEFLAAHQKWGVEKVYPNNNGLTILHRQ